MCPRCRLPGSGTPLHFCAVEFSETLGKTGRVGDPEKEKENVSVPQYRGSKVLGELRRRWEVRQ